MTDHDTEVGVDWVNGLVLHDGDTAWHPWDEGVFGPRPDDTDDITCPTCGQYLGMARARDGFTAQWWADKTIHEHEAEYHD